MQRENVMFEKYYDRMVPKEEVEELQIVSQDVAQLAQVVLLPHH